MLKRLLALTAAPLLSIFMTPQMAHANPSSLTQVDAKIKPSLVYVGIQYKAWVAVENSEIDNYLASIGEPTFQGPFTLNLNCTGFVVDPTGYIATAGHCVNPTDNEVMDAFRSQLAKHFLNNPNHQVPVEVAKAIRDLAVRQQWKVEGQDRNSPPNQTVQIIQPDDPKRIISSPTTVQVMTFEKFEDGDNALLKVNNEPSMPAVTIDNHAPATGTEITSTGFPGTVGQTLDETRAQQPSFKTGTVSSTQIVTGGSSRTEISAGVSPGMSGGPTFENASGHVIGINSYSTTGEAGHVQQNFNFITDTQDLRQFLEKNGVHLQPVAEKSSSTSPWLYVGIAVAVVVVIAAVLLAFLLVRRRRHTPATG